MWSGLVVAVDVGGRRRLEEGSWKSVVDEWRSERMTMGLFVLFVV